MTRAEYEQKLEALEREIAALRQEVVEDEPTPPHPRPYPENDQFYYYVNAVGEVKETNWNAVPFDLAARELGNVFVTENAAEIAIERLKILAEMREWAGNWDDPYALAYNKLMAPGEKIQVIDRREFSPLGELRFATEKDAVNCIKAVGRDRLIKYYFGVSDHEADAETE